MLLSKAFAEQWACALESGKYKQGSGQLRDKHDCYCCLGVAADLLAPDKWVPNNLGDTGWGMEDGAGEVRSGYLTTELRNQIGLDDDVQTTLVNLNDDIGRTVDDGERHTNDFKAIAQHIRRLPTRD